MSVRYLLLIIIYMDYHSGHDLKRSWSYNFLVFIWLIGTFARTVYLFFFIRKNRPTL